MGTEILDLMKDMLTPPVVNTVLGALVGSVSTIVTLCVQNKHNAKTLESEHRFKRKSAEDEWARNKEGVSIERTFTERKEAYKYMVSSFLNCERCNAFNFDSLRQTEDAYALIVLFGSDKVKEASHAAYRSVIDHKLKCTEKNLFDRESYDFLLLSKENMFAAMREDLDAWLHSHTAKHANIATN